MSRPDDHIRAYLGKHNLLDTFERRAHRLGAYYHSSERGTKGITDELARAARHFCLGQRSSMLVQHIRRSKYYLLQVDGAGEFALRDIDVDKIRAVARPSPFGDLVDGRDRVDAEVRDAFEIPSESFRFVSSDNKETESVMTVFGDIRTEIAKTLFTRDTELEIVPYKLNLYPKGGHFRPHVDTPNDPERLVATLVVQLPTPFKGGALVVRHNGISERMEPEVGMAWMAFYPDCQHEVERVTDGNRITITFHVLAKDPAQAAAARPDVRREAATAVLAGLINKPMGLLLTHVYTQAAVERGILRGVDAKLRSYLETALPAGSKTEIVPVMAHLHARVESCSWRSGKVLEEEGIYLADAKALGIDSHKRRAATGSLTMPSNLEFVSCLARPIGCRVRRSYEDPIEHTGNDSRDGHIDYLYFNTAIIVTPAAPVGIAVAESDDVVSATRRGLDDSEFECGHTFVTVNSRDLISQSGASE